MIELIGEFVVRKDSSCLFKQHRQSQTPAILVVRPLNPDSRPHREELWKTGVVKELGDSQVTAVISAHACNNWPVVNGGDRSCGKNPDKQGCRYPKAALR